MSSLYRCLLPLSVCCLVSCGGLPTAPEPAELSLSSQQLRQKYPSLRQLGIASMHSMKVATVKDGQGEAAYLGTGGAVLVKASVPAISASAPEILLTNDIAELRGRSVVKKSGLLYTGDADDSKIIVDGVMLTFEGPHSVKQPAAVTSTPALETPAVVAPSSPPPPAQSAAAPAIVNQGRPAPLPVKRYVPANTSQAPAKPKPKATQPKRSQLKPAEAKPAAPKPELAPKPAAPVDRAKVLQLMREPE